MNEFTTDWVTAKQTRWRKHLSRLAGRPGIQGLELGSYEGRSACWFLEHILTGSGAALDCVDSWNQSDPIEERFDRNTARYGERIRKHKSDSFSWLINRNGKAREPAYDLIYVDAEHSAVAVLQDLTLCWPLLRPGGILICDDYLYQKEAPNRSPKVAVDGFFGCREDWLLLESGYQFVVQKKSRSAETRRRLPTKATNTALEAVVVCVDYADYLQETLPLLAQRVDRVVVVTTPNDTATSDVAARIKNVQVHRTNCLYAGQATFNKGAAINEGLQRLSRSGWVLHIDADVAVLDPIPLPGDRLSIWGAKRVPVVGRSEWGRVKGGDRGGLHSIPAFKDRTGPCPSGYFQLWHWPTGQKIYSEAHDDASRSDIEFARQWRPERRKFLPDFFAYHLETADNCRGANWRGRKTIPFGDVPAEGVLTAANERYWPTLRLNVQACEEAGVAMAVADHGLKPSQREWLAQHGVIVMDVPLPARGRRSRRLWQQIEPPSVPEAWYKPSVCLASPFERTIWIDADAVPLRGIEAMFQHLDAGPWLTLESWSSEIQARQMYLRTVRDLVGEIPASYPNAARINSGVFGFRRGDNWIREWAEICRRILSDAVILARCRLRDQAALVVLLCDLARRGENHPQILEDRGLNWPANGCRTGERTQRKRYCWEAEDCLSALRHDHPEISVVHWMGAPKPWAMQ